MLEIFVWTYLALVIWMTIAWVIQVKTANAGVADVMWAMGLGLSALYFGLASQGSMMSRLLVGMLAGIWATRLAMHLLVRVLYEGEDGRYRFLRERWGARANQNFFVLFQIRALAALVFALPLWAAAQNRTVEPTVWTILALLVWTIALVGESISDFQLASHRVTPSLRKVSCRQGFWHYSRHPNYFFELLHWVTYALLAIGFESMWLALLGPLAMLVFLYRITGIPACESQALRSRGEDYLDYQRCTNALFPWFPKRRRHTLVEAKPS